ncbi:MAG: alpha/beta hydrolase family protein [Burkholderiaceae bacterium]
MSTRNQNYQREAIVVRYSEQSAFTETYGFSGSQGLVAIEGQRLYRPEVAADTVYLFMHPSSTLHLLPMPTALASAGFHVLCAASRYPKNDSALIMEKVAIDLGAWVRWARETAGYKKVVLVGWSGGGSLSLFYQAQAEQATVTHTPAGDPVDLVAANLPAADGLIFIAAHLSRAETLTEWLDPSVLDESHPDNRDIELDIYSPQCPFKAPFDAVFVKRFRQAQVDRNRRITQWCQQMLARLQEKDDPEVERAFIVHRTMCDPRWIDTNLDPNGRVANHCYLGDPRVVNVGPAGLARFSTCRSWLSQWSFDLSNAKGPANAARIRNTPVIQIVNQADDAVPATHNPAIRDALATSDKTYVEIAGATHYYSNQPEQMAQCISAVRTWSEKCDFSIGEVS